MARNKRKLEEKNGASEIAEAVKSRRGKGLRNATATAAICATAFGAYYSLDFRAASSDWFNRLRDAASAKWRANGEGAPVAESEARPLEAPSFRDFLTAEYGEEGARELLSSSASVAAADAGLSNAPTTSANFADYVVAEDAATSGFTSAPFSDAPSSFADFVAAEDAASESFETPSSFADFVAAEDAAVSDDAAPESSETSASFADYVAARPSRETALLDDGQLVEKKEVASREEELAEDETTLTARLRSEMASRGVDAPKIERWGDRFWRASGYAATREGVATYCEAVDVDPASAQRTALEKFDAVKR
ncbi:MAG: hypothetical protein IKU86_07390 [Thermoguttaceae bacterium]|nr:hypothetical protein [Thermoguttaceae bacterium]